MPDPGVRCAARGAWKGRQGGGSGDWGTHRIPLHLPLLEEDLLLLLELRDVPVDRLEALPRRLVVVLCQAQPLHLKLHHFSIHPVDALGLARHLHPQLGGALVHQVDGLVGKEPVGYVSVAKHSRRDEGRVLYAHAVVYLVPLLEAAEDGDGVFHRRGVHKHLLEAPLQRRVLLDILAVFVQGGGSYAPQLPPSEEGLEEIGCVHRPLGRAGAHHSVYLVNEHNYLSLRVCDLLDYCFEPLLELPPVLCARHQRSHVEREQLPPLKARRHVSARDPLREPLRDGRLAHPGLADEHRVVLCPAREDLNRATNLLIASDDWIQLPAPGLLRQVPPVLGEGLVRALGRPGRYLLVAAHLTHRLLNPKGGETVLLHHTHLREPSVLTHSDQKMLHRREVILHAALLRLRLRQDFPEARSHRLCASARHLGLLGDVRLDVLDKAGHHGGEGALAGSLAEDALAGLILQQGVEQELGLDELLREPLSCWS
mmetsp:Transcript_7362/g.17762  ORF Transcript_7362/g.17762 Transcript_7362/m.17762 type:complete len:484 (+) Transcript_7362:1778-3229(+)